MSKPLARWNGSAWEPWFTPTPEIYKTLEVLATACGAAAPPTRRAEQVWVEAVDEATYAAWRENHPSAKPVEFGHTFLSATEASVHLGYAARNYVNTQLVGSKRGEFVPLGCGVSVCFSKNLPD